MLSDADRRRTVQLLLNAEKEHIPVVHLSKTWCEITSMYSKSALHILDDKLELVLGKTWYISATRPRKTDVNDAMWIADRRARGLIHSIFVPPAAIPRLRDLAPHHKQQIVPQVAGTTLRCVMAVRENHEHQPITEVIFSRRTASIRAH